MTDQPWHQLGSGLLVPSQYGYGGFGELPSGLLVTDEALPEPRPTAVDLFCGCGGFSLGIIEAGFRVLAGVENDCDATVTYLVNLGTYPIDLRFVTEEDRDRLETYFQKRHRKHARDAERSERLFGFTHSGSARPASRPGVPVFWFGDIAKLSGAAVLDSIGLERGELDLVVGGPPCQGFTRVNRNAGPDDPRNLLTFEFARLVVEMQPRSICMENVPELLRMTTPWGTSVIDEFCSILERGEMGEAKALRNILIGDEGRRALRLNRAEKRKKQEAARRTKKQRRKKKR